MEKAIALNFRPKVRVRSLFIKVLSDVIAVHQGFKTGDRYLMECDLVEFPSYGTEQNQQFLFWFIPNSDKLHHHYAYQPEQF